MGITDNVKETVTLIQKIDNIDLYRKVLDLQSEVMAVVEENTELKRRLRISGDLTPRPHPLAGRVMRREPHAAALAPLRAAALGSMPAGPTLRGSSSPAKISSPQRVVTTLDRFLGRQVVRHLSDRCRFLDRRHVATSLTGESRSIANALSDSRLVAKSVRLALQRIFGRQGGGRASLRGLALSRGVETRPIPAEPHSARHTALSGPQPLKPGLVPRPPSEIGVSTTTP